MNFDIEEFDNGCRMNLKDPKEQKQYSSIDELKNKAKKQDVEAMTNLAILLISGESLEPKNPEKAVELLTFASEKKYIPAYIELGKCYYSGIGVEQSYTKAKNYFNKALKKGHHPLALFAIAKMSYERAMQRFKNPKSKTAMSLMQGAGDYFEILTSFYRNRENPTDEEKDLENFYKFYYARALRKINWRASKLTYDDVLKHRFKDTKLPEKLNIVDGQLVDAMLEIAECCESK